MQSQELRNDTPTLEMHACTESTGRVTETACCVSPQHEGELERKSSAARKKQTTGLRIMTVGKGVLLGMAENCFSEARDL